MNNINTSTAKQLLSFIHRVENLEAEKSKICEDIKDVYTEAKANGFEVKILKKIISIRKQDREKLAEEEAILETYLDAIDKAIVSKIEER